MIQNPAGIVLLLLSLVSGILFLSKAGPTRRYFKYLPVPLWCYFIPTLLATFGVVPSESPLYPLISRYVLPACLVLLLLETDLPSILRLSPKALGAMIAGTFGIYLGATVTFMILIHTKSAQPFLGEIWKGWGCLSATWTGGSANMIAAKEILQTPESIFSNLIVTDTVIAYTWMALLVFVSQYQDRIDRTLLKAEPVMRGLETGSDIPGQASLASNPASKALAMMALGAASFGISWIIWTVSAYFPTWGNLFNRFSWMMILATALPLALSTTPVRKAADYGSGTLGNFLLYFLLTSIGARANLAALNLAPVFISLGLLWVTIHGIFLLIYGRIAHVPLSLLACASQANVGGTVSTPLVATVYQKELAPVGVVLAVLGNIYGTYAGILMAEICRKILNSV